MPSLGAITWVRNNSTYDYHIEETVECLKELADSVVILDGGSDDGTDALVESLQDKKTRAILLAPETWHSIHGREKLATMQNIALGFLDTDYYILCQADEIISEHSFDAIREAIETGHQGFYCSRINFWKDANHVLDVPHHRKPCSTEIVRLARTDCFSYGDGESIAVDKADQQFLNQIRIMHYGFVRKKEVMKAKVINMQESVFEIAHDPRLDGSDVFRWDDFFSEKDLVKFNEQHPKFIKNWIATRP